jgi:phosphoglycolate phosphatase
MPGPPPHVLCAVGWDGGSGGAKPPGPSMIRAVVFDLDGTLVDSRKDLADATNALIRDLGSTPLPDESIVRMVGEGVSVLVRRALAAASLDPETPSAVDRFLRLYDARLLNHTVPYDGTVDMLKGLRDRYHLSVLTNKPARPTTRVLEGLQLIRFFERVIGGDTPLGRKPDPTGLLHLAREAGATPRSTLLVGDSAVDLRTARNAGTRVCLARYGFGYRFEPSAFRGDESFIDAPGELPALLESLITNH